jgi:hypothetical protein
LEFLLSTDEFEWEETTTNELPDFSIIENANSSKIKGVVKSFTVGKILSAETTYF